MVRDFLVTARDELEMTHEDVATQAEITRQYYGMIENGLRNPAVPLAKKISEILKVEWTLFFENQGNETLLDTASNA